MSLLEIIKDYESKKIALGHFNISNFDMLKAISNVARRLGVPMVIGTSEGEWGYLGCSHISNIIKSYNIEYSQGSNFQFFLNGDHTHSIEGIKKLVEVGYDMVIFDKSGLSFEENIKKTKEAVDVAKKINPNVLVEAELGYIGKSSKLLDAVPEDVSIKLDDLPTAKEAKEFVDKTGIDLLAPAVGNIHGMLAPSDSESSSGIIKALNPNLYIGRIKEIKEAVGVPLVLHGGSGLSDEDFKKAIKAGISLIHISTEIRNAWRNSLKKALENSDEIAPYKIVPSVISAIEKVIEKRSKLFYNL